MFSRPALSFWCWWSGLAARVAGGRLGIQGRVLCSRADHFWRRKMAEGQQGKLPETKCSLGGPPGSSRGRGNGAEGDIRLAKGPLGSNECCVGFGLHASAVTGEWPRAQPKRQKGGSGGPPGKALHLQLKSGSGLNVLVSFTYPRDLPKMLMNRSDSQIRESHLHRGHAASAHPAQGAGGPRGQWQRLRAEQGPGCVSESEDRRGGRPRCTRDWPAFWVRAPGHSLQAPCV